MLEAVLRPPLLLLEMQMMMTLLALPMVVLQMAAGCTVVVHNRGA